jgi:hypothetical protein
MEHLEELTPQSVDALIATLAEATSLQLDKIPCCGSWIISFTLSGYPVISPL